VGWEPNPEQLAAIETRGRVFVSAGAGTGKTAVLVERFVRAVCDEGLDVESLLVITYTKRAAGELRTRIRTELVSRGRLDLARRIDTAWISTIHGFCLRLLKSHPFAAGIDPRFRVLDESQSRVLQSEAFEAALEEFLNGEEDAEAIVAPRSRLPKCVADRAAEEGLAQQGAVRVVVQFLLRQRVQETRFSGADLAGQ